MRAIFNLNIFFNNHFSGLSNKVYNFNLAQGIQKIPAVKVRGLQKTSHLLHKTGSFLSPRTLKPGISRETKAKIMSYNVLFENSFETGGISVMRSSRQVSI